MTPEKRSFSAHRAAEPRSGAEIFMSFVEALAGRLGEIEKESKRKRVEKVIAKAGKM